MNLGSLLLRLVLGAYVSCVIVVQMAPLVVVALVSVSPSTTFDLVGVAVSWRWYERLWATTGLWRAFALSAEIAAIATACSLVLGTLCAVGIARGRFPGAQIVAACLLSPLMLPGLVLGIAMLQGFRTYWLRLAYTELLLAHVVVTLPFVMRIVLAAIERFNFVLIDAARTLGLSYGAALWKVLVPNLTPAILTGGLFAFLASFDNYPVSLFLVDARNTTLPIRMLEMIEETSDPRLAALSTVLLLFALVAVLAIERLVGLRKLAAT
jgi:putative spermidine/putrescine transport system permease protein